MFRLNHFAMVVETPRAAAAFYKRLLVPEGDIVPLGDNLHLRDKRGSDMAFHKGTLDLGGSHLHFGFLAERSEEIDALHAQLVLEGVEITDNCIEDGFRSVKFRDPWGYECEVYWEAAWP